VATSPKQALIITDFLFTDELAEICAAPLVEAGWQVDFRRWDLPSIEAQRGATRRLENNGPGAVACIAELDRPHDYSIVVTQFAPISTSAIGNGRTLKLIAVNRSGLQNIAVDAAQQTGVEVFNVPGRNANAVAEHTLALMLAQLRFVATSHAALKAGIWTEDFPAPGPRELAEVAIGIIGYGQIGRRLHELLRPFNSTVRVHDPFLDGDIADAELVDLEDLLVESDVVTMHVPLNEATRSMVGDGELALMKPSAILVNTARAELVDQAALRRALTDNTIGGAALDVFDQEPLDANDLIGAG